MVVDAQRSKKNKEDHSSSERRSALKKDLTEPTLLEMSGYSSVYQELTSHACIDVALCSGVKMRRNQVDSTSSWEQLMTG